MHVLTAPWFEYELLVQFNDGSNDVNATYSNFSVRPSGPLYAISYDAFTSGAVGKLFDFLERELASFVLSVFLLELLTS